VRILQVDRDEAIAYRADCFEFIFRFRNQLVNLQRFAGVDGNDATERRVQICPENKNRPFVVDEIVFGVGLVQQFDNFRLLIG